MYQWGAIWNPSVGWMFPAPYTTFPLTPKLVGGGGEKSPFNFYPNGQRTLKTANRVHLSTHWLSVVD